MGRTLKGDNPGTDRLKGKKVQFFYYNEVPQIIPEVFLIIY